MHRILTGAGIAAALSALACGSAFADAAPASGVTPQVTVSADYSYVDLNHSLGHLNDGGAALAGVMPLGGSNFSLQGDVAYHNLSANGGSVNNWSAGGALGWTYAIGRAGVAASYTGFDYSGAHADIGSYGVYGQWYPNDRVTVGVKGGAATVNANLGGGFSGDTTFGYAGGELVGYISPDLTLTGSVDWAGRNGVNITTGGVQAEYLVSHSVPLSVFGGYSYTDISGAAQANTINVGVKYYFGGGGSLVDHQRHGVDNWGPLATALRLIF
jgi:hypothetical protein